MTMHGMLHNIHQVQVETRFPTSLQQYACMLTKPMQFFVYSLQANHNVENHECILLNFKTN